MDSAHLPPDLCLDYAEGLLDPAARRAADAHLENCAECRLALEAARGYFTEMAALEPFRAPDRFLTRVHERIARRSPWKRALAFLSSPRFLPVPLAGLAAVLVGVYLVLAPQMRQEETPMPTVALAEPPTVAAPAESPGEPAPEPPQAFAKAQRPEATQGGERQPRPRSAAKRADRMGAPAPADEDPAPVAATSSAPAPAPEEPAPAAAAPAAPAPAAEAPSTAEATLSDEVLAAAPKAKAARAAKREEETPALATLLAWAPEVFILKRKAEPAAGPGLQMREEEAPGRRGARQEDLSSLDIEGGGLAGQDADLRAGLERAGARILRVQRGAVERYELEVDSAALARLEAYLRRQGDLVLVPRPRTGEADTPVGPVRLTLRVERMP